MGTKKRILILCVAFLLLGASSYSIAAPSAVTNLSVTDGTNSVSATISFNIGSNTRTYWVQRCISASLGSCDFFNVTSGIAGLPSQGNTFFPVGTLISYEDFGVDPGVVTFYTVKSCDENSNCTQSGFSSGFAGSLDPRISEGLKPQYLAGTFTYSDRIKIRWTYNDIRSIPSDAYVQLVSCGATGRESCLPVGIVSGVSGQPPTQYTALNPALPPPNGSGEMSYRASICRPNPARCGNYSKLAVGAVVSSLSAPPRPPDVGDGAFFRFSGSLNKSQNAVILSWVSPDNAASSPGFPVPVHTSQVWACRSQVARECIPVRPDISAQLGTAISNFSPIVNALDIQHFFFEYSYDISNLLSLGKIYFGVVICESGSCGDVSDFIEISLKDDDDILDFLPAILAGVKKDTGNQQPNSSCGVNQIYDCSLNCVDELTALSWVGDGYCDDGAFGIDLLCPAFSFDQNDCG